MRWPLLIASLIVADAALSPAAADCTCRSQGRDYELGQSVCLQSPKGARIATCGMVLNNTSWQFTETPVHGFGCAAGASRAGRGARRMRTATPTARKPHSPRFRAQPLDSRECARHRRVRRAPVMRRLLRLGRPAHRLRGARVGRELA